jgi:(E)-4-hydroxy-3-methylbut-2-enyl-diphosphate synthase
MAVLLRGIGDTIRVTVLRRGSHRSDQGPADLSISRIAQLCAAGLARRLRPHYLNFFQELADQVQSHRVSAIVGRYRGVEEFRSPSWVASATARRIKISMWNLARTGEDPKAPVYADGRLLTTLRGENIISEFIAILEEYVDSHYSANGLGDAKNSEDFQDQDR